MSVGILHLSDIHVRSDSDPILQRAKEIAAACFPLLPRITSFYIVVSGDISFSGKDFELNAAKSFLLRVRDCIKYERDVPVFFITCPGNHDCNFDRDDSVRKTVLSRLQKEGAENVDDALIEQCVKVQAEYRHFAASLSAGNDIKEDALWSTHHFTVEGRSLAFDAINVSWVSQKREDQGSLAFPHKRYESKLKEHPDIRIAVLHHPLNWFGQPTYRPFRAFLRSLANIVMTGHEHSGTFGENYDVDTGQSAYVEGWVLQGEQDLSDSSFGLMELRLEDQTYRATKFGWNGARYREFEEGSWTGYRNLPTKQTNPFSVTPTFSSLLRDPGGFFQTAHGTQISLEEIFVFPDMERISTDNDAEVQERVRSSVLLESERLKGGVLLVGEEKVGITSLLFRVYERTYEAGLVPVYLRGGTLGGATDKQVEAAIRAGVVEQYGEAAVGPYFQLPKARRVLLLDEFEECPVKANGHRIRLVELLQARYDQYVLAVDDLFQTSSKLTAEESDPFGSIPRFKILSFGYARRVELARRWFGLQGRDGTQSEDEFTAKCHQAERLFDTVMLRNIVPPLPLYLLTLLQAIDAGARGSFEESSLGTYYYYLFQDGLKKAGVPGREWDSVVTFCAHLAWHLHSVDVREIDKGGLRRFAKKFEEQQHNIDFERRIEGLVRARVLSQNGDVYRFRYPYIYYYLKGSYLSANLDDDTIREYIRRCCEHLYVRENANTVVFLAHHAHRDKFFIECLLSSVQRPFAGVNEAKLDGTDTDGVKALVASAPKLMYEACSPEEHRERVAEHRDNAPQIDGLSDKEEEGGELSEFAQLVGLYKSVEILGQVLKNQYAVLKQTQRVEMLTHLFRGPLRGVTSVLQMFTEHQSTLVRGLNEMFEKRAQISDKQRRDALARRLAAFLLQMAAFGLVRKAAISVSAKELTPDVEKATADIGSPAAKLIDLAVKLDSPDPIPRASLEALQRELNGDIIGGRMIQLLVLERLYMFRTTHEDKAWLDSKKILGHQAQAAIGLVAKNTRKVKGD